MNEALREINHGTYGGYQMHVKHGVPIPADDPCGCRKANTEYHARYQETSERAAAYRLEREMKRRAIARLIAAHPREFDGLLDAEYEAVGM